jgi:hypothetical protein
MLLLFKAVESGGKQIFIFWAFLYTFAQPYWSLNMLPTSPYYGQCTGQIQFVVLGWLGRILNRYVGLLW